MQRSPPQPKAPGGYLPWYTKLLIGLGVIPAVLFTALIALRLLGLIRPFSIPTGAMAPAIPAGDHVIMENFTYLDREPKRGDIVVFKTDGLDIPQPATFYTKRVAGEPGEHLRISDGNLFINEKLVVISNAMGGIAYNLPPHYTASTTTDLKVPTACYFVLGDNSMNSFDSRFWGSLPRKNIIGRMYFCYWPPKHIGLVK